MLNDLEFETLIAECREMRRIERERQARGLINELNDDCGRLTHWEIFILVDSAVWC